MTTREPTWTEQDRAEAIALTAYRASLCPHGCGHLVTDTTTHEDDGPEFITTKTTCRACAALLEAKSEVAEGKKANPYAAARLWQIEMRKR